MNYDLLDKISKDVSKLKISDIKWTNELESQYRGELENFLLAHGAAQNPKMRNKPHQLNLCDGISGGQGFNTFTFTLKEDGNWIYNQWNDSKQRGVLESFLVNKGICSITRKPTISLQTSFHCITCAVLNSKAPTSQIKSLWNPNRKMLGRHTSTV